MERLKPSKEGKSYKSVSKKIQQFLVKNDTCMKKQIQEKMKGSKVINNKNTHAYMQEVVNTMFMQIHARKGINMFGERAIDAMIKEFKQLY